MESLKELFTENLMSTYRREFDDKYGVREKALEEVFLKYRDTHIESEILIKVILLNHIYSAGLNSNPPLEENKNKKRQVDVDEMAKRLSTISDELNVLFHDESKPHVAVNKILDLFSDECYFKPYSFATKYCNFHNPDKYPIADSFSKGVLYYYFEKKYKQKQFNNYKDFCEIYGIFKKCVCVKELSVKEIDKSLWMFGKKRGIKMG